MIKTSAYPYSVWLLGNRITSKLKLKKKIVTTPQVIPERILSTSSNTIIQTNKGLIKDLWISGKDLTAYGKSNYEKIKIVYSQDWQGYDKNDLKVDKIEVCNLAYDIIVKNSSPCHYMQNSIKILFLHFFLKKLREEMRM